MTELNAERSTAKTWLRRLGLGVGALLVTLSALLVLGAYAPHIPYVGLFGSIFLSVVPAFIIVLPLIAAILVWQCGVGKLRLALMTAAAASIVGASNITYQIARLACETGKCPSIANAFGSSGSLDEVRPDQIVTYTRSLGDDLTLRIFKPEGQAPPGGWPVYMHIHGGGWIAGSNKEQSADWRWYADKGWIVVSVGYSLSGDRRHLWDRVMGQLGCAMAWTNANIGSRGGNPERLAMRGGSAGGNLALNAAYMANAGKLPSICGGTIPKVSSVTPIYPGVDLVAIYNNPHAVTGPDVRQMVVKYTGGTPAQFPDRYAAVASATYISPVAPPTLMFISKNDHLVPLESMRRFATLAKKSGVDIETVEVPFAEHGFDITGIGNTIVRQATLAFINKHDPKIPAPTSPQAAVVQ